MRPCKTRWGVQIPVGFLAIVTAALSGCTTDVTPTGYPLSLTVRDCLKGRPHFVDVWGCVQNRYVSGQMGESDKRMSAFLKLGDDLAGRVSAKEITDTEAKTQLSAGTASLDKL